MNIYRGGMVYTRSIPYIRVFFCVLVAQKHYHMYLLYRISVVYEKLSLRTLILLLMFLSLSRSGRRRCIALCLHQRRDCYLACILLCVCVFRVKQVHPTSAYEVDHHPIPPIPNQTRRKDIDKKRDDDDVAAAAAAS